MSSLYRNSDKLFSHCMGNSREYVIKGNEILTYSQSPFAFYCNHFVDDSYKDSPNDDVIQLAKNGVAYEDRIVEDEKQSILRTLGIEHEDQVTQEYRQSIPTNFKIIRIPTMREGFKTCLDKMIHEKINVLHNAPLLYLPAHIIGKPDTLEKQTGKSIFGSYHYVVKEIKSARNITIHHILQTAFYTLLIGRIQQRFPEKFYIINGDGEEKSYLYEDYESLLIRKLIPMMNILQHKEKPKPVYNNVQYPWTEYGNKLAIKQGGTTLIIGIKEKTAHTLEEHGFKTINDVASCNVQKLSAVPRIGIAKAIRFKTNAVAIKHNKIIKKTDPIILDNKIEMFMDFEGESFPRCRIYLIGILVREKRKKNRYISFLSKKLGERGMWREYIKFMKKQKNYVIYHWGHYEKTHMLRMATKHKTSREAIQTIFNNLIDLHPITTDSFAFPTYKNDLKSIANKINYYWDEPYLDGSNIGSLYHEYVRNRNSKKQYLKRVLDYNKNDCEATMVIKDWLLKQ